MASTLRTLAACAISVLGLIAVGPGCGSDDSAGGDFGGGGGDKDDANKRGTIDDRGEACKKLVNNCSGDGDCSDCEAGRNKCNTEERHCIECGGAGQAECTRGKYCSKSGDCIPNGVTCETDDKGTPRLKCVNSADCAACDPQHRVCVAGACTGCTPGGDTTACVTGTHCDAKTNTCVASCPATCTTNDDCGSCGPVEEGGVAAHLCNRGTCAQCAADTDCGGKDSCDLEHGVCLKPCGIKDVPNQRCNGNDDCTGCSTSLTNQGYCKKPVNGGLGQCGVNVSSCLDLDGLAVLPDPYNRYTQTCAKQEECANQSADINVGKLLRDATGLGDGVVKDANLSYPMHRCAAATIPVVNETCGVCVPCSSDGDCDPVDIDKLAGSAFGPLGEIATSLLLDQVFGRAEHKLFMYCKPLLGKYGVCLPCSNFLTECSSNGGPPASNAKCDHDICKDGSFLGSNCTSDKHKDQVACIAAVCGRDAYCCRSGWDARCVREVEKYCPTETCTPETSCSYRAPGNFFCEPTSESTWYACSDSGIGGNTGRCGTVAVPTYCHRTSEDIRSPAVTELFEGKLRVKCFPTPDTL